MQRRFLLPAAAALVLLGALGAPFGGLRDAAADSFLRDAALGQEIESDIGPGDVQTWRLQLTPGLTVRVEARADDDDGAALTLRVLDPQGAEVGAASGDRPRLTLTAAATGAYRAEVRSDVQTEYEFRTEAETGGGGGSGGGSTGAGETLAVHLDVPREAVVRVDVRRISGAPPEVVGLRDGAGRNLAVNVRRATADRVRLREFPVPGAGGIDVFVRGQGGAAGEYEVEAEIEDLDDDDQSEERERVGRRLILALSPGADPFAVAAALGYELKKVGDGFIVVETPEEREGFEDDDAIGADEARADVLAAAADARVNGPEGSGTLGQVFGSDLGRTDFTGQQAFVQVRLSAVPAAVRGAGIVVAVLDTGVDATHPDLAGRVLPGRDFVASDDDASEEANGLDDDLDGRIDEGVGHGTFVAGLVLAVAPDARVLPVRVLDSDARGEVSDILAGIYWAVDQGADVLNLSFGTDAPTPFLADAVDYAIARGVIVVAAGGNGGSPAGTDLPAAASGVVAIGGTAESGAPATFTDGSKDISAAAPATGLVGPFPGGGYARADGTSFAAAIASGGAALLAERRPGLTSPQAAARVSATARGAPRGLSPAQRRRLGGGRLDLGRLAR